MTSRPDLEPGFWNEYVPPTLLGAAVQMPLHPPERWIDGVLTAYVSPIWRKKT